MSNRISKRAKPISQRKVSKRNTLLTAVLSTDSVEMAPCSYCKRRQFECIVSKNNSSRYSFCIRHNRSQCDVSGLSPEQLQKVAAQHRELEIELEAAEEEAERVITETNAKLRRLRRQKRMWYEKMMKAVDRGIDNLAALKKLKKQKRQAAQASVTGSLEVTADFGIGVENDWSLNGFGWGAIPADPSSVVGKIFSEGVKRLLSG